MVPPLPLLNERALTYRPLRRRRVRTVQMRHGQPFNVEDPRPSASWPEQISKAGNSAGFTLVTKERNASPRVIPCSCSMTDVPARVLRQSKAGVAATLKAGGRE